MNRRLVLCALVLLLVAGCTATLTRFVVPPRVWAGHEFEVFVEGSGGPTNLFGDNVACVLQLPIGFTVASADGTGILPIYRDDPVVLSLYTPEPGHYLAGFSGWVNDLSASLGVHVRAPAAPGGPFTVKVSLAAPDSSRQWQITDPPGVGNFAAITASTHARTLTVTPDPTTSFVLARDGLPTTSFASCIRFADVDGDGNDDILVTTTSGSQAWLARPGRPWIPTPPTGVSGLPVGSRLASGDFDRDGLPDLVDARGTVFYGDGRGNWTPGPTLPLLGPCHGVAVGDVDGNGLDDVAFGGWLSGFAQVFLNNGNGSFTESSNGLPPLNSGAQGVGRELLLADATGDGLLDVVWACGTTNVWAGDGRGNWVAGSGIPMNRYSGAAVGDLTGDGRPELVLEADSQSWGVLEVFTQVGPNQWVSLAGTGLPTTLGYREGYVVVVDYDRDGWLDILASGGSELQLWRNVGAGAFSPAPNSGLPVFAETAPLAVGDYNGDSFPDLAAVIGGMPMVWENVRTGLSSYGAPCSAPGFPTPSISGNGPPRRGNAAFSLALRGGSPNGLAVAWVGTSKRFARGQPLLPLPLAAFGAPGCRLLAEDLLVRFTLFDPSGLAVFPLAVPNAPALLRQTFFAQGAAHHPGANPLGFLLSGGLAVRIE